MKKMHLRLLSIVILVICSAVNSYSQYNIPVTTSFKTPYGNVPQTHYVPTPYRMNGNPLGHKTKYKFTVVLKNDSTFTAKTLIDYDENDKNSITVKIKGDKEVFYPVDTKSISRTTFEGQLLIGIAADSCWLFKAMSGKINMYSPLAETGVSYISAIQHGDNGPIVPLTKENLLIIVGNENEKLNQLIEKRKLIKAVEYYNAAKN